MRSLENVLTPHHVKKNGTAPKFVSDLLTWYATSSSWRNPRIVPCRLSPNQFMTKGDKVCYGSHSTSQSSVMSETYVRHFITHTFCTDTTIIITSFVRVWTYSNIWEKRCSSCSKSLPPDTHMDVTLTPHLVTLQPELMDKRQKNLI